MKLRTPSRSPLRLPGQQQSYQSMMKLPQMQQFMKQQYYSNAGGRGPGVQRSLLPRWRSGTSPEAYKARMALGMQQRMLRMLR